MKYNVYAVRDEVAGLFKYDFKRARHGEALRFFGDGVQDGKSEIAKHPGDFSLFFIATFDDESGRFESLDVAQRLASALDYVGQPGGVE